MKKGAATASSSFFHACFQISNIIPDAVFLAEVLGHDEQVGMEERLPLFFEQQMTHFAAEARGSAGSGEDGSEAALRLRRLRVGEPST